MDVLIKRYFWVVTLLAIALCALFAGRAASRLIEQKWLVEEEVPLGPNGMPLSRPWVPPVEKTHSKDPQRIIDRNVFCSQCAPPPPVVENADNGPAGGTPQKTQLPIELVSTMWLSGEQNEEWSIAVIRDTATKEKDARAYNKGKFLDGGQEILRVDPKRVYLMNGNRVEYAEMEGAGEPPKAAAPAAEAVAAAPGDALAADVQKGVRCNGNNCTIDRPLVAKLLANTTALATAARFVPSVKDGRPNGFKLYAIQPSSIFGKLQFQNGDTIKSINGMEMTSPDQALGAYTKLQTASHLTAQIERRGETVTMDYTIQ